MKFAPEFREPVRSGEKFLTTRLGEGKKYKNGQILHADFQDGKPEIKIRIKRGSRPWRAIGVWFDRWRRKKDSRMLGFTYMQLAEHEGFEYYKDFAWFLSCTYCYPEKGKKYINYDAGKKLKFITYEFEVVKCHPKFPTVTKR